ncbi:hypothetical protein JTB14_016239 [Gonioctena quinquepunctata]|nr:hypothetical protein JTB14_016239 [Gonioctena quinquepunctata]
MFLNVFLSISAKNTTFGLHPWNEVIKTTGDQSFTGNIIVKKFLTAKSSSVDKMRVDGRINGFNFTDIANDAVTFDTPFKIFGNKTFRNLTIDKLKVVNDFEFDRYLGINQKTFAMKKLEGLENLSVEHIHFGQKLNNVDKSDLGSFMDDNELDVKGDKEIDKITVFGNVYVESNFVNNVNLGELENNTVKIDEPFHFDSVEFTNDVIVSDTIALDGQIDNLDLDNIFQNTEDDSMIVLDRKHFHENVRIDGAARIDGNLNGVNVSDLCGFASGHRDTKRLVLEGNIFLRLSRIHYVVWR